MKAMINHDFGSRYSIPAYGTGKVVTVSEFRDAIDHVFKICTDFSSCIGDKEKAHWVEIACRFGSELKQTICNRATERDWDRRERALDRSAGLIAKVLLEK